MTSVQIFGLVSITVFYGIYIGKQIAMRAVGIDTARLAKGEKPRGVSASEGLLAFVTFAMAAIQYLTIITGNSLFPLFGKEYLPLEVVGTVLATVGVGYFAMAIAAMRRNWRAGIDASQKTELVYTGIYRFSRNPAFVGFDLLYIGFALMFPNWLTVTFTVAALVMFHKQILNEEAYLSGEFGERYLYYKRRTLRY